MAETMRSNKSRYWAVPLLLFCLALFLRTSGLSHDLHLGNVYHPDTSKQVQAVQRFLGDDFGKQYYQHIGFRDYDGYPFFNSHLVEHLFRGYASIRAAVQWQLGIPPSSFHPDPLSIYWVIRLMNSVFSALAVVLVFFMGLRHFGPGVGLFAALFLALSPLDITISNYASSDSTTAFFALLAVFFALRIIEAPKTSFYLGGALAAACAFSAKYHGMAALVPLGLAHILAFPGPRDWISSRFWGRSVLFLLVLAAGAALTSPALLIYPSGAYKDILNFIRYTADFGMTEEMIALPVWERFHLAAGINLPQLVDVIGIIPLLAVVAGMLYLRRNPYFWTTLSLPLFFVVVGLTTKPLSHPDYFVVITGLLFLCGAAGFGVLTGTDRSRILLRTILFLLIFFACAHLANRTWNEIFFFRHNDSRRIAETWALDNIPLECDLHTRAYTFVSAPWEERGGLRDCTVIALSDRSPDNPAEATVIHQFRFEQDKLSRNRNWNIRFLVAPGNDLTPDFTTPVLERLPSSRRDNLIQAQAPALVRSPRVVELRHRERYTASVLSEERLARTAAIVVNSEEPTETTIRFGGRKKTVILAPHTSEVLYFETPRRVFLTRNEHSFYSLEMSSRFNKTPVRIVLAFSDLDLARELYLIGHYEQSFAYFHKVGPTRLNASERLAMAIAGLTSGQLDPDRVEDLLASSRLFSAALAAASGNLGDQPLGEAWFFDQFGVHPGILELLIPSDRPAAVLSTIQHQTVLLGTLLSTRPGPKGLNTEDWRPLFLRGQALARQERFEDALMFFRAALELDPRKKDIFMALESVATHLPEREAEISGLLSPFRSVRVEHIQPRTPRFANDLSVIGFQIDSAALEAGTNLNFGLLWDIPRLDVRLHELEYRVLLVEKETREVVMAWNRGFVDGVMKNVNPEDYALPETVSIPFQTLRPGAYQLFVQLEMPKHNRVLRLHRPIPPHESKRARIAEFHIPVLTVAP